MKKILYFFLLLSTIVSACVDIKDIIKPTISPYSIRKLYNVQDTVKAMITVTDDKALDSLVVVVQKLNGSLNSRWRPKPVTKRIRGGRRYIDTVNFVIPVIAEIGLYTIETKAYDKGSDQIKNSISKIDTFEVSGDNKIPIFKDLKVVGFSEDKNGIYKACRLDVIQLEGLIIDNDQLKEIRVTSTTNVINEATVVSRDTIRLKNLFLRNLKIPQTVVDNTTLSISITAIDRSGNTATSQIFRFLVDCDDQQPVIEVSKTFPIFDLDKEVDIIEGGKFQILEGAVSDNRFLRRFAMTVSQLNASADTVFKRNLNTSTKVLLSNILKDFTYSLPANTSVGTTLQFTLSALDSSGNFSVPYRFLLNVIKDEPPTIFVTNAYLDNIEFAIRENVITSIKAGQLLRIEGKIEEDNALQNIKIIWGEEGKPIQAEVDLSADKLTALPFDFSDVKSKKTFRLPTTVAVGTIYVLEIIATDSKKQTVVRKFRFRVV